MLSEEWCSGSIIFGSAQGLGSIPDSVNYSVVSFCSTFFGFSDLFTYPYYTVASFRFHYMFNGLCPCEVWNFRNAFTCMYLHTFNDTQQYVPMCCFSRGMHFENVSVLLEGMADHFRDVKYCW